MPFQVIFEGLKDNTPEQRELIKGKLVDKFKLPAEKAERMIVSAPIVVKKGLTQDQANKYKAALDSIGAIATVRLVPDETDISQEPISTPIAQAPIAAKTIEPPPSPTPIKPQIPPPPMPQASVVKAPNPIAIPETIIEPPEIKISESKPLPPMFQEPEDAPPPKTNPLEKDYPIFYGESSSEPPQVSSKTVQSLPQEASTVQQPASAAKTSKISGEWWQTVQVLNPPFDEAAKSVTPITSGRISANDIGFSIAHPMIERIPFGDVQIISTCQVGFNTTPRLYIDIFIASTPRPIRLDLDLMNFASFGISRPDDPAERLAVAVTALIDRNPYLIIDLATYKLLKDKTKVKIVVTDRDIEKYCGKLQIEVDKGLTQEVNSNIISCQQANELLNSNDPWASTPPPPAFPYPGQPGYNPTPGMPGQPPGFPPPGQMVTPQAYNTQPVRPPNTMPGTQNPTQMAPPVRSPQGSQDSQGSQGSQPYSSPYLQQPPAYPAPPAPAPGFNPQPNPYAPPQNRPYAPPMPGQPPAYQQGGFPSAPGQFPVAPPMGQFPNPTMSNEVNKAFEEANTALILSVAGFLCGCLSPLAIVGLIKAQNVLKVLDKYKIEENRGKAVAAKVISIIALVIYAITLLSFIAR